MKTLIVVTKGKGVIVNDSLRCGSPRKDDINKICNKLLVKKNILGQIAGNFMCSRCNEILEVKLVFNQSSPTLGKKG